MTRLSWNPAGLLTLAVLLASAAASVAAVVWLMIGLTAWAQSWGAMP